MLPWFSVERNIALGPVRIARPRDIIKMKDSEEYLEDFHEIWRILGEDSSSRSL